MLTSNLLGGSHAGHSHGGGGHSHGGGGHSQEGGAYFSGNIGYQFTNNIGAGVNMSFSGEGIGDPEASLNATTKLNRRWKFNASAGLAAPLSEVSQEQNLTTRFNISGGPSYKKKRFMAGIEGRFSKSIYGQSHEEHEEEHGPTAFGDEEEHEEEHAHAKTDMSFGASISAGYRVTRKLTVSASFGVDQITALAEEHEEEHVQGGFEGHEEEEVHSGVAYMTSVEVLRATYSLGHFSVGGSFNMTSNGEGISAPDTPGIAFELSYEIH